MIVTNLASSGHNIATDIQRNIWENKHHKDVRDLIERVLERFETIFKEDTENYFRAKNKSSGVVLGGKGTGKLAKKSCSIGCSLSFYH